MGQPSVASFDVFDTLLTRAASSPASVFILLGRELSDARLTTLDPAAFRAARMKAETEAAHGRSINLVTLGAIYAQLVSTGVLLAEDAPRAMSMEMALEARLLRPVEPMRGVLNACRERGQRIAFLSDMYLPAEFIRRQLEAHGLFRQGDTLLVSSDVGADKHSGGLYRELARRLGVRPRDIIHAGDNPHSDVRAARAAGVDATRVTLALPGRFATILDASSDQTEGLASLVGGCSRLAFITPETVLIHRMSGQASRYELPNDDERLARMTAGAQIVAPVLASFALWLLQRAETMGLNRLYFVARDGEQLINVTRRVAEKVGSKVELRYLYGSRQAWHLPSVTEIGEAERSWLFEASRGLTLGRLLKRVGLTMDDVREHLAPVGLSVNPDAPIAAAEMPAARALFDREEVLELVRARAAQARTLATDYFRQEGLLTDDRWAMVDVGWMGRLQVSLSKVLALAGGPTPKGLYFGLAATAVDDSTGPVEAFAFDRRTDDPHGVPSLETFIELFCAATHGTVLGYRRRAELISPMLKEERNTMALDWGLLEMREGVERAIDAMIVPDHWRDSVDKLGPAALRVMDELTTNPTRDEAMAFAGFLFDDDQSGEGHSPLATAFTVGRLIGRVIGGPQQVRGSWRAGAIALAAAPVRESMSLALRLRARRERGAA